MGFAERALLLIDVQQAFDDASWGKRNNLDAEQNMCRLLERWRTAGWPVVHIQHVSEKESSLFHPMNPGFAFKSVVAPQADEVVVQKFVNSAFIGTNLEEHLRERGIARLVIVGLTTDHCVSTTTRMAGNLGFDAVLVSDATATFDRVDQGGEHYSAEHIHRVHLASLHGEFCQVMTAAEVLRE